MGPELVAAILGPMLGGCISMIIMFNRKNTELITRGVESLHKRADIIEQKMEGYVKNEVLAMHIKSEDEWHKRFSEDLKSLRDNMQLLNDRFRAW